MMNHSVQSLFLGTFAMGFATIGDGVVSLLSSFHLTFLTFRRLQVLFAYPAFGERFAMLAWACWWIDSVISMTICIGLPFMMFVSPSSLHSMSPNSRLCRFTRQVHSVPNVTGVWLLPVVSPIVAAAAGGIVADILKPEYARITIIIS